MFSSFFFIIFTGLPLIALLVNILVWKTRIHPATLFLLLCIICYASVMLGIYSANRELKNDLDRYDLDHNGEFSPDEQTPQMKKAMHAFANDTGRTLAPMGYITIIPIYVSLNFALFYFFNWIIGLFWKPQKIR